MRISGEFLSGYAAGFVSAGVVALLGLVAFGVFFTGPALDVGASSPDSVSVGENFALTILVENPHKEQVELDNIDFPDRFFEVFEIQAINPDIGSPTGGFGTKTWFPEHSLDPLSSIELTLDVWPRVSGTHVIEFEVCNNFADCSQVARGIEVTAHR